MDNQSNTLSGDQDTHKGFTVSFDNDLWEHGFTQVPNYLLKATGISQETRFACACVLAHIYDRKTRTDEQQGTFIGLDALAAQYGMSARWWWERVQELVSRNILIKQKRGYGKTLRHKFVTDAALWDTAPRAKATRNRLEILKASTSSSQAFANMSVSSSSQTPANLPMFAGVCESCSQTPASLSSQTPASREDAVGKKMQIEEDAVGYGADAPDPLPDFLTVLRDERGEHWAGDAPAVKPDAGNGPKAPRTPSKPSLQQADPEVYARREAIKARYFERYTAEPWDTLPASRQKYANADAERIARACASLDEALALMQAVYDERWSNGTYPNRAPFKLSACPGKLKAFRDGCLAPRPSASSGGSSARNSHSGMGRTDGWRAETFTIEDYCAEGLPGRTSCRMAMGHPHDTAMCGRTGLVEMGNGARVANPNVYNDEHITEFPHAS